MKNKIISICVLVLLSFTGCNGEKIENEEEVNKVSSTVMNSTKSMQENSIVCEDMHIVSTIEELMVASDYIIQGKVKSKTKKEVGYDSLIEYEINVDKWMKGDGKSEKEILLTVINNETGRYADEERYYNFDLEETYIFFVNFEKNTNRYWLSNQSAGLIKVQSDGSVQVQEHDLVFGKCKTYDDVLGIIDAYE